MSLEINHFMMIDNMVSYHNHRVRESNFAKLFFHNVCRCHVVFCGAQVRGLEIRGVYVNSSIVDERAIVKTSPLHR